MTENKKLQKTRGFWLYRERASGYMSVTGTVKSAQSESQITSRFLGY